MKSILTGTDSSAIRPIRPTRSGLAVSVPGLLAIALLLQGVAVGQKLTVAVHPASTSLTNSQSVQFIADVTGAGNPAITWSINPAVGTISSTGLYTAPATVSGAQTVTVTATTSEASSATTTVRAKGRKKLPAMPVRKMIGRNTATVVRVDAKTAVVISRAPV